MDGCLCMSGFNTDSNNLLHNDHFNGLTAHCDSPVGLCRTAFSPHDRVPSYRVHGKKKKKKKKKTKKSLEVLDSERPL
ncbi:hypothetical protein Q5P01_008132 [Channa striata]|uniref:Uncharacterized protein n=1 Tax=Channa striata TaxID=64152 RepID=A0AA88N9Q4_CHASR|nr:hypothetical protein Q5P01_008132 [Channa striata]